MGPCLRLPLMDQVVTLQVIHFKEENLAYYCCAWCEPCASITVHTEFCNVWTAACLPGRQWKEKVVSKQEISH